MRIDSKTAAARLLEMDDITLLCHRDPDGDTYGSASALFDALSAMGKRVNIRCPISFPQISPICTAKCPGSKQSILWRSTWPLRRCSEIRRKRAPRWS